MCLCDLEKHIDENGHGEAMPAGCGGSSDSSSPRCRTCSAFLITRGLCRMDSWTDAGRLLAILTCRALLGILLEAGSSVRDSQVRLPRPELLREVGLVNWRVGLSGAVCAKAAAARKTRI